MDQRGSLDRNKKNRMTMKIQHIKMKEVLRGEFIALNACMRNEESLQISNLSFYIKKLDKEDQIKSKAAAEVR